MILLDKENKKIIELPSTVIDINGKKRMVKSMKQITHDRPVTLILEDEIKEDVIPVKYIEVVILGKRGNEWMEWWEEEIFLMNNPNLEIVE